jgi:retron-type reverse transcriptase
VFERLLLNRVLEIEENAGVSLSGYAQHGFKTGKSTVTATMELQSLIAASLDQNEYVAVASLDLSAAFDVVNVDLLLDRLFIMGIPDDIIELLAAWLKDRAAYVEVSGECSSYFDVTSGTVQGSILGPILFNLFMSPLVCHASTPCYADDSYHLSASK